MAHREEQIIEQLAALLAANTNLAAEVFTNRVLSLADDEGEMPAVCVQYGEDDPQTENMAFIDSLLAVRFIGYAVGFTEEEVRRALSEQRRQVHITLQADITLGLAFVSDCRYGGAQAPVIARTEQFVGERVFPWRVLYRMNRTDPE